MGLVAVACGWWRQWRRETEIRVSGGSGLIRRDFRDLKVAEMGGVGERCDWGTTVWKTDF